jgi:release factor glutamine methyltransferase
VRFSAEDGHGQGQQEGFARTVVGLEVRATVKELYRELCRRLSEGLQFLPDKPEETPDSTVSALWHTAVGAPKSAEQARNSPLPPLDAQGVRRLEALIERRLAGTPLAHLTERQQFMGLEMLSGPQALVPRKETELLGQMAIDLASELNERQPVVLMVDVCTGCGNVALAAAHHVPALQVYAADLSEEAVELARRNASHLELDSRVQFRAGDLLAPFDNPEFLGRVDLLSCNPPYISSAKVEQMTPEIAEHEPHLAFDGGPFGVAILMRLLQDAPRFIRPGGWLAFEVGLGQGPGMLKRLEKSGVFRQMRTLQDDGAVRCIAAQYLP